MSLVTLKCKKCGNEIDDGEVCQTIISEKEIEISVWCYNCGVVFDTVKIKLPNELKIMSHL